MPKRYFDCSAILAVSLLSASSALSSEQGFTAIGCIELFEMEASGEGYSCALIGRKSQAENRAIDALLWPSFFHISIGNFGHDL